jgi:hypothetical protein
LISRTVYCIDSVLLSNFSPCELLNRIATLNYVQESSSSNSILLCGSRTFFFIPSSTHVPIWEWLSGCQCKCSIVASALASNSIQNGVDSSFYHQLRHTGQVTFLFLPWCLYLQTIDGNNFHFVES